MKLFELFDSKISIDITKDEPKKLVLSSRVGDRVLVFTAERLGSEAFKAQSGEIEAKHLWWIEFGYQGETGSIEFTRTHDHLAIETMSFLLRCVETLIKRKDLDKIIFTSDDPKLTSVYTKLFKRVEGFKLSVTPKRNGHKFQLERTA